MKAILMSFQPTPCSLIASGEKTDEVRKKRPKIETPFKVYMYATKSGDRLVIKNNGVFEISKTITGKVIGEFICDRIIDYEAELWDDNTFERIVEVRTPYDFEEYGEYEYITISDNGDENWKDNVLCKSTCLTIEAFRKYLGTGISEFCTLHISNLVIYDKPRELSDFRIIDNEAVKQCEHRKRVYNNPDYTHGAWLPGGYICNKYETDWCTKCKTKPITRPPQSWCYVEEVTK